MLPFVIQLNSLPPGNAIMGLDGGRWVGGWIGWGMVRGGGEVGVGVCGGGVGCGCGVCGVGVGVGVWGNGANRHCGLLHVQYNNITGIYYESLFAKLPWTYPTKFVVKSW